MGDRVWVGTWRPHRPRIPIVAQYTGPGPKYSIQGTTGDYSPEKSRKHVYRCAPIHSISFRSKSFRVDSTPGPARYTIPKVLGPNTVDKTASPCYSMKWKSNIGYFYEDRHKTPGPAAYNRPKLDAYKHRAPEYSMSSSSRPPGDRTLHPGPAAYKKSMSSGITFGIRHSEYTVPLIMEIY
uniref:Ciliary microtubule associated protein 1A n=1 Tax=Crocodylus porosus TaxID=8502 RepID=A0A7M4EPH4_CROPO